MNKYEKEVQKSLITKSEAVKLLKKLCKSFHRVLVEIEEKHCVKCQDYGDCLERDEECEVINEAYDRLLEVAEKLAGDRVFIEWEEDVIIIKIEGVKPEKEKEIYRDAFSLTLIARAFANSESFKNVVKGREDYKYAPEVSYVFEVQTTGDFREEAKTYD
ncbi:MAG: hypothetical protein QW540_09905 [Archaeoglobaceae archaeon]